MIVNKTDIKNLTSSHKIFEKIKEQYGIPPNWQRPQGFISLSKIILEQQVSLASAEAHFNKLNGYIKEFSPKEILKLSDEEMRSCQISRQKAKYLRELSNAVINKYLVFDELPKLNPEEVRKKLTSIKGIGDWTTDIYLMFCLQSKDIFPLGRYCAYQHNKRTYKSKNKDQALFVLRKNGNHTDL